MPFFQYFNGFETSNKVTLLKRSRVVAMKGHGAAAIGGLLATLVLADNTDGVVQWGIQQRQAPPSSTTRIRRRASTFEEVISNQEARGGYFASCRMGTPAQDLTLQLDTGSSDIWVPDSQARVCAARGTQGCDLGSCMPKRPYTHIPLLLDGLD